MSRVGGMVLGRGGRMGTLGKVGWELDWGRSAKVKRINVNQESWNVLKPCGKNSILRTLGWFWHTG